MKNTISIFLTAVLSFLPLTACQQNVYPISSTEFMMNTVITVSIYDGNGNALDSAMELCRYYDNLFDKTNRNSDIYKVNHSNGQPITVAPDTVRLIQKSLEVSTKSGNAFNPTLFKLVELWDVRNRTIPPEASKIKEALKLADTDNIQISGNQVTVLNGTQLDLGGIAKGFIADRIKEYLLKSGVTSAIINLGGNNLIIGNKYGRPFTIGLQKPFGLNGETVAILSLSDKTCVTSGIYQQYFEFEDKIYHHIINTSTGYPVDNNIASVTVITDSSALADGLSTACLSLGIEKGTLLAQQYSAELIYILTDGQLILTDGLKQTFENGEKVISLK